MSKQKTVSNNGKSGFDVKSYAKGNITEEEVAQAKASFDLFDSDNGGTVDIKGNSYFI